VNIRNLIASLLRPHHARPTPGPIPAPTPPPVPGPEPTPPPVPGPAPIPDNVTAGLLEAHNAIRAAHGRPPLAANGMLAGAAASHAGLMAQRRSMSHQLPGEARFDQRIAAEGYRYSRAAENVAAGQRDVAAVMQAWQGSPGHMANIVGPCTEMGGAMATDGDGTPYWSVSFASPAGQFGMSAARPMITTVMGVGGKTSSIRSEPEGGEERP
jgi:uncharacterized protein YkwD